MNSYFAFLIAAIAAAVTSIILEAMKDDSEAFERGGALGMIDRVANLSLEEFDRKYNGRWPVVITDVVGKWKASDWTQNFFLQNFAQELVTMKSVRGKLKDATSTVTTMEHFVKMKQYTGKPNQWLYIEDEILIPRRPRLKEDIGPNIYTQEDFFQLFPREIQPWNAMILWGTTHSRSSLHIDPYNWTGTNAVLWGKKRWKLYPPGQDELLYATTNLNSGFPLNCHKYGSPVDAFDPDLDRFPNFVKARGIQFDLNPGELLIIPSGWFHQAYNIRETFAISSQVMNSANYQTVLEEISKAGHYQKSQLPENMDDLSPSQQVEAALKLIPQHVIDRGRSVMEIVLNQLYQQAPMMEVDM